VWGSSSAEALSKVQTVLQVLIDAGRVQEDDRGVFRVKRAAIPEQNVSTSSTTVTDTNAPKSESELGREAESEGRIQ
jgi:hypothetical protein